MTRVESRTLDGLVTIFTAIFAAIFAANFAADFAADFAGIFDKGNTIVEQRRSTGGSRPS